MSTQTPDPATTPAADPEWVAEGMRRVAEQQQPDDDQRDKHADDGDEHDEPEAPDLDKLRAKIAKVNREAAALRKREAEAVEKAKALPDFERRAAEAEAKALRFEVAAELGIPAELARRLQGGTRDELVADAEALLKLVAPTPRVPTARPADAFRAAPGEPVASASLAETGARIFGR